jgi:uncharacterized protein (UPF0262 family)
VTIADLVGDHRQRPCLGDEEEIVLHVSLGSHALVLATFDEAGAPRAVYEIDRKALRSHVDEYLAVIKRLQHDTQNPRSSQLHTLDMAKKVVHDASAKALARELPGFGRDHESYRRLFSLLLSLCVDVTKLPGARAH